MGRLPTGRMTQVCRLPKDMDVKFAVTVYYDWLPIIEKYREELTTSPRSYKLAKLLEELKPLR